MAHEEDYALDMESLHPFEVPSTKIVHPRIIKQRINNQSGVFSIASSEELLEKRHMNETDSFSEKLIKVGIPAESFKDIHIDLNTLGVNASIFSRIGRSLHLPSMDAFRLTCFIPPSLVT